MRLRKEKNSNLIAGLDEVGMGCLAGPVLVCVTAFPEDEPKIGGVRDSKSCPITLRKRLIRIIYERATFVGWGFASAETINRVGISEAWQRSALMALEKAPALKQLVVDGDRSVTNYAGKQTVLPKADATHWQVSAASIVAKVLRDSHMRYLDQFYPGYGFDTNAGYGTPIHRNKLKESGPTPIHREKWIRKTMAERC